jgi:hypothetical protein
MAQQEKKSKAELAAQSYGMTVEQWQRAKSQNAAARGRGKRPAGTAGADVQLAVWGEVEGQEQLTTTRPDDERRDESDERPVDVRRRGRRPALRGSR